MIAPVHRLRKDKIIWLSNNKCKHGHSYLEHYNCYLNEKPDEQRAGYFDIETSNLDADFGIMLCYCIKDANSDKVYEGVVNPKDIRHNTMPDKKVVEKCIKDLANFDIIYGYYSTKFDLPFLRTRAVSMNIPFPHYGSLKHRDVYYIVRNKFKLHRNRLEVACNELLGKSRKTHFDGNMWRRAIQGDKTALKYILDHCRNDVIDLEDLTNEIIEFAYPQVRSI